MYRLPDVTEYGIRPKQQGKELELYWTVKPNSFVPALRDMAKASATEGTETEAAKFMRVLRAKADVGENQLEDMFAGARGRSHEVTKTLILPLPIILDSSTCTTVHFDDKKMFCFHLAMAAHGDDVVFQ